MSHDDDRQFFDQISPGAAPAEDAQHLDGAARIDPDQSGAASPPEPPTGGDAIPDASRAPDPASGPIPAPPPVGPGAPRAHSVGPSEITTQFAKRPARPVPPDGQGLPGPATGPQHGAPALGRPWARSEPAPAGPPPPGYEPRGGVGDPGFGPPTEQPRRAMNPPAVATGFDDRTYRQPPPPDGFGYRRDIGGPAPQWNPEFSSPRHDNPSPQHQEPLDTPWNQGQHSATATPGGQWNLQDHLRPAELVEAIKISPSHGWRYWIYRATFRHWNLGESPDERHERQLTETIGSPLRGTYSIAVLGAKGGVGKTTKTAGIGSTFANIRKDKAIAIDTDPSQGANLADRVDSGAKSSIHQINRDPRLEGYSDIRSHVGQNKAGLDVLASARHVSSRATISSEDLTEAHERLQRFYSVLLMDCGVNFDDPVMRGVLAKADAIVVVASVAVDGAVGADAALRWLHQEGYNQLLSRLVVVINEIRPTTSRKDRRRTDKLITSMTEYFSRIVNPEQIFVMPFDQRIANAGFLELAELDPQTRRRFLEITAAVARGFAATTDVR